MLRRDLLQVGNRKGKAMGYKALTSEQTNLNRPILI